MSEIMRSGRTRATECFIFLCIFIVSRIVLLAVVGNFVGGHEFSDDVAMHIDLIGSPLQILAGNTEQYGQHPPLLPLMESIVAQPFRLFFSDFYSIRMMTIVYEAVLALFVWLTLQALQIGPGTRRLLSAALIFLPVGWMTSVIFAQDEVIGAAFVAAAAWLLLHKRMSAAIILCSVGIAAAKIFLALPLFALLVFNTGTSLRKRLTYGIVPFAAVYTWVWVMSVIKNTHPPLAGFNPDISFGVNLWPYIQEIFTPIHHIKPVKRFEDSL
ncbi:hypothetical protein ACFL6I_13230 [candidate division KSB1 bacterium]